MSPDKIIDIIAMLMEAHLQTQPSPVKKKKKKTKKRVKKKTKKKKIKKR